MAQFTPNESETLKFLERDFNQCFEQMRHYDKQIFEIIKFLFTAYTLLIGISVGLYKFGIENEIDFALAIALSLLVALIIGLFIYALIIRNRVYYVFIARYINEHRATFFKKNPMLFENLTGMYKDYTNPPFFNPLSSQSWLLYIVSILNSLLLSVLIYISIKSRYILSFVIMGFCILNLIQILWGILYLRGRKGKNADQAVFQ